MNVPARPFHLNFPFNANVDEARSVSGQENEKSHRQTMRSEHDIKRPFAIHQRPTNEKQRECNWSSATCGSHRSSIADVWHRECLTQTSTFKINISIGQRVIHLIHSNVATRCAEVKEKPRRTRHTLGRRSRRAEKAGAEERRKRK